MRTHNNRVGKVSITVQLAVHDCRGILATLMLLLTPLSAFAVMRPAATDGNKLPLRSDISGRNLHLCVSATVKNPDRCRLTAFFTCMFQHQDYFDNMDQFACSFSMSCCHNSLFRIFFSEIIETQIFTPSQVNHDIHCTFGGIQDFHLRK